MQLLKLLITVIVTAVALMAGLVAAALAAVVGVAVYLSTRVFRSRRGPSPRPTQRNRANTPQRDGVIDITATEVETRPSPLAEPSPEGR
jgi:hypothetical protein